MLAAGDTFQISLNCILGAQPSPRPDGDSCLSHTAGRVDGGLQGCTDPQRQSYPVAHQYVSGSNGEAGGTEDVLTPSFLPFQPYPEEGQNTLVSEEIFQKAEEKYH